MKSVKKLLAGSAVFLTPMVASAGTLITITWSRVESTPVPTMGDYSIIALSILLSVLGVRLLKKQAHYIVPAVFIGTTITAISYFPDSGAPPLPAPTGCDGSVETDKSITFKNSCEDPIRFSYDDACSGALFCSEVPCVGDRAIMAPGEVKLTLSCPDWFN